ncbi:MAG TPA: biotin--[acetyl-CoA-carboxylase] ligase, partial [Chromatiaceae bacterium]|nr:biotin--[acetyl-CoA-carboxylase] ligase [Chromatiaceae bacterium]
MCPRSQQPVYRRSIVLISVELIELGSSYWWLLHQLIYRCTRCFISWRLSTPAATSYWGGGFMRGMDHRLKRLVELLMDAGDYVPGPVIAGELGVSRSMVHRLIDDLRRRGFIIVSHSRRGYKLLMIDDLRLAGSYMDDIGGRLRYNIHYVESCSSTQDIADLLARQGAGEGTVVLAEEMTMGRGRLGRRWFARPGGLWFTIILRPEHVRGLHLLSLALGLSVVRALESLLGLRTGLKWPNDVLYSGKKLAGVLVE